jgi:hypothetical protein
MKKLLPLLLALVSCISVSAQLPADSGVGIGTALPLYRLDVQTGINNDGLRLRSINTGNLRLRLSNAPANKEYSFLLGGPGSAFGPGNFVITDVSRLDSARFLINGTTGNIAIGGGTTNPTEALTVNGMVQMTGMRLTHNAGANRMMVSNASGEASWLPASALSLPAGSGTTNYLAKWTPTDSALGNSQLFDNGTNVGIGTNVPQSKFEVRTTDNNDGIRILGNTTGNAALRIRNAVSAREYSLTVGGSASPYGNGNFAITNLHNPDTAVLLINGTTGNIAIGAATPSPTEKLVVGGNIEANGIRLYAGGPGLNRILMSDANGNATWRPQSSLNVTFGQGGTRNFIPKWTPTDSTLGNSSLYDSAGFVGIGNTAPLRKLDINSNGNYTGINITSPQIPSLNLTSTNGSNTGREVIRFGEPSASPGSSTVNAQIGYYRSSEAVNAGNLVLSADNAGTRPDISISKTNNGNVGIGVVNATQKLEVNGTVRSTGLIIPTNAAAGRVLTSDALGNATWQAPAAAGGSAVIYSSWITSPYNSRDTTVDGTCLRLRHIDAPSLSNTVLSQGLVTIYFRIGSIGPYQLPYISDAGAATNQINAIFNLQKIFVYRHTYNTCRFNSGIPESYPGQPVLINLPQSLEYRYVIIAGTQAGGRMALGPNEHYANSVSEIPDMGPATVIPGKIYSSVKD